jgi:SAM-dependent methyltransferase
MKEDYQIINNIKCYAPKLANINLDYPKEVFEILYKVEDINFWFVHRNKIIQYLFKKYLGTESNRVLEIGCGTGYVLEGLHKKFPNYQLQGSEIHLEGIKFAQKRLPNMDLIQLDATKMPFVNEYNAVGAFDVLEHIEDDVKVIQEVYKSLKTGGLFFVSIPQHQSMWSVNDEIAYHKRRYSQKEIIQKLSNNGFEILYISSFVFILLPFMYISRFFKQRKISIITDQIILDEMNELQLNTIINSIFGIFMKMDVLFIKAGISLPFGGSLITVARKK